MSEYSLTSRGSCDPALGAMLDCGTDEMEQPRDPGLVGRDFSEWDEMIFALDTAFSSRDAFRIHLRTWTGDTPG